MDEQQLRKDIAESIARLHNPQVDNYKYNYPSFIIKEATILNAKIAALADIIARRHERISERLVRLTWVLAVLTFVLLLFTITLYEDAHAQMQREQFYLKGTP